MSWNAVKSLPRRQQRGYRNEASTYVDACENSRGGKEIWLVAATLSAVATGAGSFYYSVTTYINRGSRSMAEWLGKEGTARFKGRLRGILLNARP